ncbi:leucine-rich repeat domain-containing protein [Limibacter armeniacum]|uniref:leucine-rich repeat domain-containing protein n=1 Tax=Limibacter armeniacum TaxID=466084 RepID=UPI002FE5835A
MKTRIILFFLLLLPFFSSAQSRLITVKVLDSQTKASVSNAAITAEGMNSVVYSNYKGYFQLDVNELEKLKISHIGYLTSELQIPPQNSFTILLDRKYVNLGFLDLSRFPVPQDSVVSVPDNVNVIENSALYKDNWQSFYKELGNLIVNAEAYKDVQTPFSMSVFFTANSEGNIEDIILPENRLQKAILGEQIVKPSLLSLKDWQPASQNNMPTSQVFRLEIMTITQNDQAHTEKPKEFYRYVGKNIKYPQIALRTEIEGMLYAVFDISEDQYSISNIQVINDIKGVFEKEVIRVIGTIPPYLIKELELVGRCVLPITFCIEDCPKDEKLEHVPEGNMLNGVYITALGTQGRAPSSKPLSYLKTTSRVYNSVEEVVIKDVNCQRLILNDRELETLSPRIAQLKQLKFLDLEKNKLSELPNEICELTKLEEIYLPFNQLESLPNDFGRLRSLRVIGLAENKFSQFPITLTQLTKLEVLDLSNNTIAEIPVEIANMKNLKVLALNGTKVHSFPDEIRELKKLEQVYLIDTSLSPEEVSEIREKLDKVELILN